MRPSTPFLMIPLLFFGIASHAQAKDLSARFNPKIILLLKKEPLAQRVIIAREILEKIAEIAGDMSFANIVDQLVAPFSPPSLPLGEMCLNHFGESHALPPSIKDCIEAHKRNSEARAPSREIEEMGKETGKKTVTDLKDRNDGVSEWGYVGISVSFGGGGSPKVDPVVGGGLGDKVGHRGGTVSESEIGKAIDFLRDTIGGGKKEEGSKDSGSGGAGSPDASSPDSGSPGDKSAGGGDKEGKDGSNEAGSGSGDEGSPGNDGDGDKAGTPACHVDGGDCGGDLPAEVACHAKGEERKFFEERSIEAKKKRDPLINPLDEGGLEDDCLPAAVEVTLDEVACRRDQVTNPGDGDTNCTTTGVALTLTSPMTGEVLLTIQIPLINPDRFQTPTR